MPVSLGFPCCYVHCWCSLEALDPALYWHPFIAETAGAMLAYWWRLMTADERDMAREWTGELETTWNTMT